MTDGNRDQVQGGDRLNRFGRVHAGGVHLQQQRAAAGRAEQLGQSRLLSSIVHMGTYPARLSPR